VKPNERQAPSIVVVGGGVAGLILATRLGHVLGRRGLARVSLIDRSWVHVWLAGLQCTRLRRSPAVV
jgi:NADH:ubiquinone reductase (H+-translocating)